jgi:hypothetical protein
MLAASRRAAKVPPDYVKTAPVEVATALTAQQLGESWPAREAQSDPADAWQEDTAGDKFARAPLTVRPENRHVTVRGEANRAAVLPGMVQDKQLAGRCYAPEERSSRARADTHGQHRDENKAAQRESRTHAKDKMTQDRVRVDYS